MKNSLLVHFRAILLFGGAVIASAQLSGPIQRAANTTLSLPPSPPQFGYSLANAFPGITFSAPLCIVSPPGETNRLFILEKGGNIVVITNLASPTRTVFMRLSVRTESESGMLGLAFHPGYATNRYFYVFSSRALNTTQGNGLHQRLSRFESSPTNSNQGLPATELPLITQFDTAGNHNGGDLHFGSDGYLYVSLGDEGAQYDGSSNSQTITKNFFSAILRLDVDKRPGNLLPNTHRANTTNYFIPADNPYVGATSFNGQSINSTNVRTEFYAVGFRNPWRMSFDSVTGFLYVGDVGQDAWEEVDIVTKGGNYGWVYREGLHKGFRTSPTGFTSIDPIADYAHGSGTNRGNSITGGVVYRGQRLSQLYGAYVFGDYETGNIWTLRGNGTNVVPFQRIVGSVNPAAFGVDPRNGDVLIAQHVSGTLMRLNYNATPTGTPLPPTLADTGAFSDLGNLTPQQGIVPYDLNVPFWSDGAHKRRWFSIPDLNAKVGFNREGNWSLPPGAVWVKHFELELTNGVPASRRRLETRFIVRNSDGVYGATYRWDDAQTNATLVAENGLDETFVIHDRGATRTQVWHYPSRTECLLCHTSTGGWALGFNTAQMNRHFDYGSATENQLRALSQAGYFTTNVAGVHAMRALDPTTNQAVSLESRVRSYLAANCANCHQPGGAGRGLFDARLSVTTTQAGLVNGPLNNSGGSDENRVIRPGSVERSLLLQRIATRGPQQMPPISTTVVDTNAVQLLSEWITKDAVTFQSFTDWQVANFTDPKLPQAAAGADPDSDAASNYLEFLVGTKPLLNADPWRISARASGGFAQIRFPQTAHRGFEVQATTNPLDPNSWRPLDIPSNRPFFSSTNFEAILNDAILDAPQKFYRVRAFEQ